MAETNVLPLEGFVLRVLKLVPQSFVYSFGARNKGLVITFVFRAKRKFQTPGPKKRLLFARKNFSFPSAVCLVNCYAWPLPGKVCFHSQKLTFDPLEKVCFQAEKQRFWPKKTLVFASKLTSGHRLCEPKSLQKTQKLRRRPPFQPISPFPPASSALEIAFVASDDTNHWGASGITSLMLFEASKRGRTEPQRNP